MSNDLVNYDEKWAALAEEYAAEEQSGGQFISTKSGVLSFNDEELPGNQMCVIVLDAVRENTYYADAWDPDNVVPPKCYAFGRGNETMAPHESMAKHLDWFEPQHEECAGCPRNEFGSAATGRGKACGNRRRLALIPAGFYAKKPKSRDFELELFDDPKHYREADMAFLKVAPTSTKEWSKYVTQLSAQFRKPYFAFMTRIWLEPDAKSQFRTCFEMIEELPMDLAPAIEMRVDEARKTIVQPYAPPLEKPKPAAGGLKLRGRK